MDTVYVETTIPSYLVSRPSRDLIAAARQRITLEWWDSAPRNFSLMVSEIVIQEIRAGDPQMALLRDRAITGLPVLGLNDEIRALAEFYDQNLGLGSNAHTDVLHIACATVHEIDYLVTWNCAHLANGIVRRRRLHRLNEQLKRKTPTIATPEELRFV